MYKNLLTKLKESDIPNSDYPHDYLDDEAMDYLAQVYEENKMVGYDIVDDWINEDYEYDY